MGKRNSTKQSAARRSDCVISCTLDLIGDRWSLLIIRDLFLGKRRFRQFQDSPEGITSNILSNRLKRLESEGIVTSRFYSRHPPRAEYLLTLKGEALGPVLKSIMAWGHRFVPGAAQMPPIAEPALARTAASDVTQGEGR